MTNEISSKENPHVKYAKKLLSSSKFRREEQCFLIEGIRLCEDAFQNGVCFEKVFYTEKCMQKFEPVVSGIVSASRSNFSVNEKIIGTISDTDTPQGIVCVCKYPRETPDKFDASGRGNIVLLEDIQNPSNLGSIFRTCDALNIATVGVSAKSCDIYNPKTLRGSMGAIFRLNVVLFDSTVEFIESLQKRNYKVYATVPDKEAQVLGNIKFEGKTCIVFGNEGNGLKPETIHACDQKITIPMNKNAESLNVSAAAGIVIWEITSRGKNADE